MKKIYVSLCAVIASMAMAAQVNVTLSVDMSGQTVPAEGVHVAGNFNDPNYDGTADNAAYAQWSPNDPSVAMTDDDLDGVYSITMSLVPGEYFFKFINGNDWPQSETPPSACGVGDGFGGYNRNMVVGNMDMTYAVCWQSCGQCGEHFVRFRVDMSTVDNDGDGIGGEPGEDINPVGVFVAGDFQGFDFAGTALNDDDANGIWEVVVNVGAATSVTYLFSNGNENLYAEAVPAACGVDNGFGGYNRTAALVSETTDLPVVCFSACDPCVQPIPVTFHVDMVASCADTSPGVNLMGTVSDWSAGTPMSDDDGDGIWSVTLNLSPGAYEYKFRIGGGGWEGIGNRQLTVEAGPAVDLGSVCFNSPDPCGTFYAPANVTFQATPGTETIPTGQVMWVMGNFTEPSWQSGALQMSDDDGDGKWEVTVPNVCLNSIFFKYVIGLDNTQTAENWLEESADFSTIGGCGEDNGGFSDNRKFVRTSADAVTVCYDFNTCTSCLTIGVDENEMVAGLSAYPNPADEMLTVAFNSPKAQPIRLRMVNNLGQVVYEENMGTVSGQRVLTINTSAFAAGVYSLNLSNGVNMQTEVISIK